MSLVKINNKQRIIEALIIYQCWNWLKYVATVSSYLTEEDFECFRLHYTCLLECFRQGKEPLAEFADKDLKFHIFTDIAERGDHDTSDLKELCKELQNINQQKKIYGISEKIIKKIGDGTVTDIEEFKADLIRTAAETSVQSEKTKLEEIIPEFKELQIIYKKKFENGDKLIGISTGFKKLDEIIDGLRKGHLWVIGGYTNTGKTYASLNIVSNIIKQGKRVVFYSLEMTKIDLLARLVGIATNQSNTSILKNYPHDTELVDEAFKIMELSKSTFHTGKNELSNLISSMIEENIKLPVDLFVIDFVQNITIRNSKSDYERATSAILEIQQLVNRLKVPAIVLSQISNEGARNSDDVVMSFKGTGAIASAADFAIEIRAGKNETKEERAEKLMKGESVEMIWDIRKNRHGRVGNIEMMFNGRTGISIPKDEIQNEKLNIF